MVAKRVRKGNLDAGKRDSQPAAKSSKKAVRDAIAGIRAARNGITLGGISIKELIEEGRRY
jgi:hypothetical protein